MTEIMLTFAGLPTSNLQHPSGDEYRSIFVHRAAETAADLAYTTSCIHHLHRRLGK